MFLYNLVTARYLLLRENFYLNKQSLQGEFLLVNRDNVKEIVPVFPLFSISLPFRNQFEPPPRPVSPLARTRRHFWSDIASDMHCPIL